MAELLGSVVPKTLLATVGYEWPDSVFVIVEDVYWVVYDVVIWTLRRVNR